MSKLVKYFRKREWSAGNGQCPDCWGVPESWLGHPLHLTAETIGHKKSCPLAAALREIGQQVTMRGQYKSDATYEICTSESGFLMTRRIQ